MQTPAWRKSGIALGALGTMVLSACGAPDDGNAATSGDETSQDATATLASAAPAALAQCRTCHSFEEGGAHRIGPNLWDVYGNPAASKPGFRYSAALQGSGLVWDEGSLNAYLENPDKTVPGGTMSFAGVRDEARRKEIVDFMKVSVKGS